jgi:hypothetical protein
VSDYPSLTLSIGDDGFSVVQINTPGSDVPQVRVHLNDGAIWDRGPVLRWQAPPTQVESPRELHGPEFCDHCEFEVWWSDTDGWCDVNGPSACEESPDGTHLVTVQ